MTTGIYTIRNLVNNKIYVGQSKNIEKRFKSHLLGLRKDKSGCVVLQSAWNKYGESNFKFEIICECSEYDLDKMEIFYIEHFNSISPFGYNLYSGGNKNKIANLETRAKQSVAKIGTIPWNKGRKASNEARKNQSLSHLGKESPRRGAILSEETKIKMSLGLKGKLAWNKGLNHTEDSKLKMSEKAKGRIPWNKGVPMSEEQKIKVSNSKKGKPSPRKGVKLSQETKDKISVSKKKSIVDISIF